MEDYLREQLVSMGPAAAKNFHDILQTYEDLADQYGLWDARQRDQGVWLFG